MDERSMDINKYTKPIQARSKHHVGDMYIHKKHKFIVRIVGRGEWGGNRMVEVVKGEVPEVVRQRVRKYEPPYQYEGEPYIPASMEYSTCALSACFEKLKAGQVLFG